MAIWRKRVTGIWTILRPTPETKTIHALHETTGSILARTSRVSPGAPCLCLRYLSRRLAWRPPGGSWAVICTTTARPEWPSLKRRAGGARSRSLEP